MSDSVSFGSSSGVPTGFRIAAQLRACDQNFIPYYVLQRGNESSGTLLLSLIQADRRIKIMGQSRNEPGLSAFTYVHREESLAPDQADEYIRRAMKRDPDLWVIEIETKDGVNPFEDF